MGSDVGEGPGNPPAEVAIGVTRVEHGGRRYEVAARFRWDRPRVDELLHEVVAKYLRQPGEPVTAFQGLLSFTVTDMGDA